MLRYVKEAKEIKASAQKVWDTLWNESTYSEWTNAFNPEGGLVMKSDWKIGGRTLFLDENEKGNKRTMGSNDE